MQVQYLHCNNTGENVAFKKAHEQEGLGVDFEHTAPGRSQQNGHVGCKFATLFNHVHAMLNGGNFDDFLCNGLWAKSAHTTLLENNL